MPVCDGFGTPPQEYRAILRCKEGELQGRRGLAPQSLDSRICLYPWPDPKPHNNLKRQTSNVKPQTVSSPQDLSLSGIIKC